MTNTNLKSNESNSEHSDGKYLVALSDKELLQEVSLRLLSSYEMRGKIFHPKHDALDRVASECVRRDRMDIFDTAFLRL